MLLVSGDRELVNLDAFGDPPWVKGRTIILPNGDIQVELSEGCDHEPVDADTLRELLARPDLPTNPQLALQLIRELALAVRSQSDEVVLGDALTIVSYAAEIATLINTTRSIGKKTRNDYARVLFAAREALSGASHTATQGFRVPEGKWTMLVCDVLDEGRDGIECQPNSQEDVVQQVQARIVTIAGRMPDQTLVLDALGVVRADGSRCPRLIEAYYALLLAIGCEPKSEDALKKARTRHKANR